ncbi:MAG: DsbA family protein [Gemmataceae bacterium]|nr:DsbA family protein [Gemmataceae bacterium]
MASPQKRRTGRPAPGAAANAAPARKFSWGLVGGSAVLVAALVGVLILVTTMQDDSSDTVVADRIVASARSLREGQQDGFTLGAADAPLALEVFEDFQCPYCVLFTANVEPALIDEYVSTGKVRLTFRNFPILGIESVGAARASVCAADQDRAWDFGLELFRIQAAAGQAESERLNVGRLDREALAGAATTVGLDTAAFSACLEDPASAATVQEQQARAASLGVRGTPSFALQGKLVTTVPEDIAGWRSLLDSALGAVASAPR